jgi:putative acyl-CoA dehydrogenase
MHERPPPYTTHPVLNQSSLLFSNNFTNDQAIHDATKVYLGSAFDKYAAVLSEYGSWAGSEATANLARTANTVTPTIRNFDRNGRRIDVVDYHPAYHQIYEHATVSGVPSFAWRNHAEPGAHVVRGALAMMHYQAESGSSCPLTMTFAGVPALQTSKTAFEEWIAKSCATAYDPANKPISEKAGVVLGMSMTEKAGGSDVRSNTTTAVPMNSSVSTNAGEPYLLKGHKWQVMRLANSHRHVLYQNKIVLQVYECPHVRRISYPRIH